MYEITIELKFDAAHRLLNYKGKCHNLHGHSYVVLVGICGKTLERNSAGFLMDFGVLKKIVGDWLDENWDHVAILHKEDPLCAVLHDFLCKFFVMKHNPTAEHMAKYLYKIVCSALHHRKSLKVSFVTIKETDTSWATYMPSEEGKVAS